MFNWFKKIVLPVKETPELDVTSIQSGSSITQLEISESEALKNQGNGHLSNGELNDAAECYRRAIALNPHYAEAYSNLGYIFETQGNLDEAVALYRKAIEFNPNLMTAHQNLGFALLNLGQRDAAEESLNRVIALAPEHATALQSLGMIAAQRGDFLQAEILLRRTLELQPDNAEAHSNLGDTLKGLGRLDEAAASRRRALEIKPDLAETQNNLGITLYGLKRLDEAEAAYRGALEINPDYAEAHSNLGLALKELGQLDDAVASYRRALEIKPDFADAHCNLGLTLKELGQLDDAMVSYRRALEIKPDLVVARYNLGNILRALGQLDDAVVSYRQALEIKPDFAEAYYNLGNTLYDLGQPDDAVASYRRALDIKPDYVEVHYNQGTLLLEANRLAEAEASYRRALELKPDYAEAHSNLGGVLKDLGQLDGAVASYRRALKIKPDFAVAHSNLIFTRDLMVGLDSASLQKERKCWDAAHAAHLHQQRTHSNISDSKRRLRIGYVSADFRDHSAIKAFGGMLTQFDRSQFDVFAYSNFKGKNDKFTELFRQNVTAWRNIVGLSDDAAAESIRQDGIDILVDLSGHSAGNRLLVFARKPAPIQITAWGYATGTGVQAMDVFFADPVIVPPQEKPYFTEEVRYLPCAVGTFFTDPFPDVNELPALSEGIITFGSLNRLAKVSAEAYRAWAEVLLAVPRSRLILKAGELNNASVRERVAGHFTQAGVAADRIIMLGKTSWYKHTQTYNQIDIALDPFPQGGGVTALEGLMMGVPMITLRWPTIAGRISASILTTLGLPDWIAETQKEYVKLAIQKASDLQSQAKLRQQLRGFFTSSVIGDQAAYARVVEKEYRQLWQEWCVSVEK